jgi:hypothetical protein
MLRMDIELVIVSGDKMCVKGEHATTMDELHVKSGHAIGPKVGQVACIMWTCNWVRVGQVMCVK